MCFSDVFKHPGEIETEVISFLPSQQKRNNTFPLRILRLCGEMPNRTGRIFSRRIILKQLISTLLSVMFLVFLPLTCHAGSDRTVTILFTGDLFGQVTPRRG